MRPSPIGLDDDDLWRNLDGVEFSVVTPGQELSFQPPSRSVEPDEPDTR